MKKNYDIDPIDLNNLNGLFISNKMATYGWSIQKWKQWLLCGDSPWIKVTPLIIFNNLTKLGHFLII